MKLVDEYSWFEKFRKRVGNVVFGTLLLFTATVVEAGVLKLDLEGCKSTAGNGYHFEIVPDIHPEHEDFKMYFCEPDFYTDGNLKYWSELDMVPHRITFTNTTGSAQDFTFQVGGDYKDANDPDLVGWDYITELTLDYHSTPEANWEACENIGSLSVQELIISPDESEIYRQVTVEGYPNDLLCVAVYNMRLAIGSSFYSGSSLQSRLISVASSVNVGDQTIPVPDVESTTFSKTMSATQGGSRTWTVSKTSSPASISIDNTCSGNELDLQKDVNITVSWTKGEVTPAGNVDVTTIIQASNTAHRDINISVVDTLYSGTTELATHTCPIFTLQANVGNQIVCTNSFTILESQGINLNDEAVATYIDPDYADIIYTGVKVATATAFVQGTGENLDENATMKDNEWISGTNLSYSVVSPGSGTFDGYSEGTKTTDDVNWTSDLLTDSGSVTFTKTIYAEPATSSTGSLSDIASLKTFGGTGTNSGILSVSLSSSATVALTIRKVMETSIIPPEGMDFNFTVRNGVGYNETFTIPIDDTYDINATHSANAITIEGLDPTQYNVQELATFGYEPEGNSTKIVDLRLPTCSATVTFTNVLADRPAVKVRKITYPTGFEAGWEMTIYKLADNNVTWDVVETNTTIDADWLTLIGKNALLAGTYKIEETPKEDWFEVARATDCYFTYDPDVDGNRSDYECIIANAQYAQITITKELDDDSVDSTFSFTQDINTSIPLSLSGGESQTYGNVQFGTYHVTENDPAPDYRLIGLTCDDNNSVTDILLRRATINLEPGETVECTFTNQEKGTVSVVKLEDGGPTSELWTFTIEGPEGIMERDTSTGPLNFEDARLVPGTVYTLCEINVHEAWDSNWTLNGTEIFPSEVDDNGTTDRCYDFSVGVGDEAQFVIDNISPPNAHRIGDYAWFDDNNNGIQDENEDPVVGLTVELLDENGILVNDLYGVNTRDTNVTGHYSFFVPDGNYSIRFSGLPANYIFSPKGNNSANDSDANSNGVTDIISVSGADRLDIDVGIYCTCLDTESRSDGSPALNTISAALMMLMTLMIGLFFVRREEQLNRNER